MTARNSETPVVTEIHVIPVAGHDDMLLNLSGAHAPFFTRNVVILKDHAGHVGVGRSQAASASARRWRTPSACRQCADRRLQRRPQ